MKDSVPWRYFQDCFLRIQFKEGNESGIWDACIIYHGLEMEVNVLGSPGTPNIYSDMGLLHCRSVLCNLQ